MPLTNHHFGFNICSHQGILGQCSQYRSLQANCAFVSPTKAWLFKISPTKPISIKFWVFKGYASSCRKLQWNFFLWLAALKVCKGLGKMRVFFVFTPNHIQHQSDLQKLQLSFHQLFGTHGCKWGARASQSLQGRGKADPRADLESGQGTSKFPRVGNRNDRGQERYTFTMTVMLYIADDRFISASTIVVKLSGAKLKLARPTGSWSFLYTNAKGKVNLVVLKYWPLSPCHWKQFNIIEIPLFPIPFF